MHTEYTSSNNCHNLQVFSFLLVILHCGRKVGDIDIGVLFIIELIVIEFFVCECQDINKWLDDTPRFSEFSSASNSPSHMINTEEYETVGSRIESEYRRSLKIDRDRPSSGTSRTSKDNKVSFFYKNFK